MQISKEKEYCTEGTAIAKAPTQECAWCIPGTIRMPVWHSTLSLTHAIPLYLLFLYTFIFFPFCPSTLMLANFPLPSPCHGPVLWYICYI